MRRQARAKLPKAVVAEKRGLQTRQVVPVPSACQIRESCTALLPARGDLPAVMVIKERFRCWKVDGLAACSIWQKSFSIQ